MNITKMEEFMRENDLMIIERCIENKNEKLDVKEEPFEKLMFFYKSALKQLELQMNIIKDEFKLIYNYDLIDHIDTRIKEPKSIVKKMEKKKYDKTYLNLFIIFAQLTSSFDILGFTSFFVLYFTLCSKLAQKSIANVLI